MDPMTNETEKAGATPRVHALHVELMKGPNIGPVESYKRMSILAEALESELSALRASLHAPVEGLPEGCTVECGFEIKPGGPIPFVTVNFKASDWDSRDAFAARLAALENKEKQ